MNDDYIPDICWKAIPQCGGSSMKRASSQCGKYTPLGTVQECTWQRKEHMRQLMTERETEHTKEKASTGIQEDKKHETEPAKNSWELVLGTLRESQE